MEPKATDRNFNEAKAISWIWQQKWHPIDEKYDSTLFNMHVFGYRWTIWVYPDTKGNKDGFMTFLKRKFEDLLP